MSGKRKEAGPTAYARLTRHERDTVQRMLGRRKSCREIAREIGRSPLTVSGEVKPLGINVLTLCPGTMDTKMSPRDRPVGGESGTQAGTLPFVSCALLARRTLERAATMPGEAR